MKMIPAHIWDKPKGVKGEPQIFDLLSNVNLGRGDVCLHSQNLTGGKGQAWSEIDFLLLTPRAVVGIEVKAGVVRSHDGKWSVLDSNGNVVYTKFKSPLVQVSDALESFRTGWFKDSFGDQFKRVPLVKIAVLCSNHRPNYAGGISPPELTDEFTLYSEDLKLVDFKGHINAAIDHHLENVHPRRPTELSERDIIDIAVALRPNLDVSYASKTATAALYREQNELTVEQYATVDQFASFQRLVIDGGAGTGKTFLLIYGAMQEVSEGKRVAVVTRNSKLLDYLKGQLEGKATCSDAEGILASSKDSLFDVVFVDEGQDLCNEASIDAIDSSIDGGLSKGRWRWFGDFQNQFSEDTSFEQDALDYLLECTGNGAFLPLKHNVRNTPNIVSWLENVCHARVGETKVKGAGPEVAFKDYKEFEALLCGYKEDPYYGDIDLKESVLLYVNDNDLSEIRCLDYLHKCGCRVSQINEFKGLEAMFVFVYGLDGAKNQMTLRDLAYKAVSRARNLCLLSSNDSLMEKLRKIKKER